MQLDRNASKRPHDNTRRRPPAQVASHRTLSLAQTQHVSGTEGPMRRWGWLTSFAVITGPVKEWQPVRARSPRRSGDYESDSFRLP